MVGPQHDMPNQTSDFRLYTHSWSIGHWLKTSWPVFNSRLVASGMRCLLNTPKMLMVN